MGISELNCIGDHDAMGQFAQLLDRVVDGEEITITRLGNPVAKLVPVQQASSLEKRKEAIRQMQELAGRNNLGGLRIQDLIAEGRK
ncbi:type II toxin-antitoxin system prevent-host-death family antitoxin [soil metagenome]